ncbi:hypothetical protein TNCV_151751 [Trichonephila clavipes]|uniref:Uncharacterized protein n=1 Tax=Trichonephila clavipes TaxID=2585209 RepID=A0A8X6RJD6_TRICX|nr:hypothetical protein TNCV_151751 [Trichonephila clavipes]
MSRSDGQCKARPQVFKSPSKLGTNLSTHCSRDKIPEGSKLANMVANDANLVAKNDANLALQPRFRQVLIESPL